MVSKKDGSGISNEDLQTLAKLVKKPITFEELCDKLNRTPSKVRNLLDQAGKHGIGLKTGNDHIHLSPQEQIRTVQATRILPIKGKRQKIGVMSDLHVGSKYCLKSQIRDCIDHFYSKGVRSILIPGDLMDGCYRHGVFELTHSGLDSQIQELFDTLPSRKGLSYHAITGNHDFTFSEKTGVNVGSCITNHFAEKGRKDIFFYGDRGAFLSIHGAIIHLWHPCGSKAYAKSYKLQKLIEGYGAGQKPDIVLAGHWHDFCVVEVRGVFGVMCPCFQGSGSAFARSLGGCVALGGLMIEWDIAGKDLIRNISIERQRYYEVELPVRIKPSLKK